MRKSWLLCVLMGAMAWGQASPGAAPAGTMQGPTPKAAAPAGAAATPAAEIPENAAVLTITGVCPAPSTA